jgi:crossover junction endodeoxyribonuclease RusA
MITLIVYGNPAPQGSKSYLGRTATGRGIIVESNPRTRPWRADVKAACEEWLRQHPDFVPFTTAVEASMVFTFKRPTSVSRAKRPYPSVYPDLGKLVRSTEDAISSSGLWKDDALVVRYTLLDKVYAGEDINALSRPGALIRLGIREVEAIPLPGRLHQPLELEAA